jgi:hypothetical protein
MQEARQALPARERIADRFGKGAAARYKRKLRLQPGMQTLNDCLGEGSALSKPVSRRLPAHTSFDGIEFADPAQSLSRHGRASRLSDLVELSPSVRPAGGENDISITGQPLESRVTINVQDTFESFEMRHRTFGLAVRREQIDRSWWCGTAPRPLVAGIDPQPSRLCAPASWIEHRDWRVVGKQVVRGEHVLAQSLVQRFQPPACAADPSGQRRTSEIDAVTSEDLRLPIKRRVIAIFADHDLCEQSWRGQSAGDQPLRRRRLHDLVAAAASIFRTGDAYHTKLRRHPVQHLTDAFADRMQRTTATAADIPGDSERNVLTRKMIRQRLAPRPRFERVCCDGRTALLDAGNVAVEIFKSERQLVGIQAFGATPELRSLQLLDDGLEALDLTVAAIYEDCHLAHQTVQQRRIGRQIFKIEPHVRFYSNMLIRRSEFAIFYAGFCCFNPQGPASRRARVRASRYLQSTSRAAPETA